MFQLIASLIYFAWVVILLGGNEVPPESWPEELLVLSLDIDPDGEGKGRI
jgi:hypothetical protein